METHGIARTLIFNAKGEVLLLIRSDDDSYRPGGYDIPGGKVNDHEDFVAAAAREVAEETNISLQHAEIHIVMAHSGVDYNNKLKTSVNYVVFGFVTRIPNMATEVILSHEHKAYEWRPLERAIELSQGLPQEKLLRYLKDNNLFKDYWLVK